MLVMNERGMQRLLSNQFTLGGDASVAAGPVGRTTTAQTDASMRAEILSWSRARGVFAGYSLDGATMREDDDANKDLYGAPTTQADPVGFGQDAGGGHRVHFQSGGVCRREAELKRPNRHDQQNPLVDRVRSMSNPTRCDNGVVLERDAGNFSAHSGSAV